MSRESRLFQRIDHVEIVPSDFEKSLAFYRDVLGFAAEQRHEVIMPPLREIIYLNLGDTVLELLSVENPERPPETPWCVGYRMMAIEVADMEEAVSYMAENPEDSSLWQRMKRKTTNAFTDKEIPGSALNYIWTNKAPKETIVPSPFQKKSMMIVLQSGNDRSGEWIG